MVTAEIDGVVVAESDETVIVEGNHYFPPESIQCEHYSQTDHHTMCGWKGQASYYSLTVGERTLENAAWFYPEPYEKAAHIKNWVAFYSVVTVTEK